ncbi:unnamed protein product [Owenia fusiformis]|uniref:Uncharacterized protein n=1 Tax=Owenia fusiformis TaxID=6347 RepID=A0A8J1TZW7_OWEFU|nr:unnamed protein product [Owenia fusiformis]
MTENVMRQAESVEDLLEASTPQLKVPSEDILQKGIALLTGGCDVSGRPLIMLPARHLSILTSQYLGAMVPFFKQILWKPSNGFAIVTDLTILKKDGVTGFISVLKDFENQHAGSISCLYLVQPKSKDSLKVMQKLLGIKQDKKKYNPPMFEVCVVKSLKELTMYISEDQLISDFGGTFPYNNDAWIVLQKVMEAFSGNTKDVMERIPAAEDRIQMLSEYDTPVSSSELPAALSELSEKYHTIMRELNIESSIDETSALLEKLKIPEDFPVFRDLKDSPFLEHSRNTAEKSHTDLVRARNNLQLLWKQAEDHMTSSIEKDDFEHDAEEMSTWIRDVGVPTLEIPADIGENTSRAELLMNHFNTGFYTTAQKVIQSAEELISRVDEKIIQGSSEIRDILIFSRKFQTMIDEFRTKLEGRRILYANVFQFYTLTEKVLSWYHCALNFLTQHFHNNPDLDPEQWNTNAQKFLKKYPSPRLKHLQKIKDSIVLIPSIQNRNQARLLVNRVNMLTSLFTDIDAMKTSDIENVLHWKHDIMAGFEDVNLSVEDVAPKHTSSGSLPSVAPKHHASGSVSARTSTPGSSSNTPPLRSLNSTPNSRQRHNRTPKLRSKENSECDSTDYPVGGTRHNENVPQKINTNAQEINAKHNNHQRSSRSPDRKSVERYIDLGLPDSKQSPPKHNIKTITGQQHPGILTDSMRVQRGSLKVKKKLPPKRKSKRDSQRNIFMPEMSYSPYDNPHFYPQGSNVATHSKPHEITMQERLDQIYTSELPEERKLNMMASIFETEFVDPVTEENIPDIQEHPVHDAITAGYPTRQHSKYGHILDPFAGVPQQERELYYDVLRRQKLEEEIQQQYYNNAAHVNNRLNLNPMHHVHQSNQYQKPITYNVHQYERKMKRSSRSAPHLMSQSQFYPGDHVLPHPASQSDPYLHQSMAKQNGRHFTQHAPGDFYSNTESSSTQDDFGVYGDDQDDTLYSGVDIHAWIAKQQNNLGSRSSVTYSQTSEDTEANFNVNDENLERIREGRPERIDHDVRVEHRRQEGANIKHVEETQDNVAQSLHRSAQLLQREEEARIECVETTNINQKNSPVKTPPRWEKGSSKESGLYTQSETCLSETSLQCDETTKSNDIHVLKSYDEPKSDGQLKTDSKLSPKDTPKPSNTSVFGAMSLDSRGAIDDQLKASPIKYRNKFKHNVDAPDNDESFEDDTHSEEQNGESDKQNDVNIVNKKDDEDTDTSKSIFAKTYSVTEQINNIVIGAKNSNTENEASIIKSDVDIQRTSITHDRLKIIPDRSNAVETSTTNASPINRECTNAHTNQEIELCFDGSMESKQKALESIEQQLTPHTSGTSASLGLQGMDDTQQFGHQHPAKLEFSHNSAFTQVKGTSSKPIPAVNPVSVSSPNGGPSVPLATTFNSRAPILSTSHVKTGSSVPVDTKTSTMDSIATDEFADFILDNLSSGTESDFDSDDLPDILMTEMDDNLSRRK